MTKYISKKKNLEVLDKPDVLDDREKEGILGFEEPKLFPLESFGELELIVIKRDSL